MKELIKQKLQETFNHLTEVIHIPYDDSKEIDQHRYASLSKPSNKYGIETVKYRMVQAAKEAADFNATYPKDNYFRSPLEGLGFYQLQVKNDGNLLVKHIQTNGDMEQRGGRFQPSDVGTCKTFQNIARYCFVKAGKSRNEQFPNGAFGKSPAEDAANKALVIFKNEILDFLSNGSYDDGKGPEISKNKMTDKQALHKKKKDLEMKLGARVSDSQFQHFLNTGEEPSRKPPLKW